MIAFRLPSLGADMDKGTLLEWCVHPGDTVKKGDIVAIVDTSKAAIDVECWHDGTVEALLVEPGMELPVGALMAALREPGETAEQARAQLAALRAAEAAATAVAGAAPATSSPPPTIAQAAQRAAEEGRVQVSPAARKRATELGIGLAGLTGTGAGGAVTLADIEAAAAAKPSPAPTRGEAMRQTIAAAMSRSKREIPHYYLAEDVPLAAATAYLAQCNATRSVTERLLLAPLLLKAVARALERYPEFNGFFRDGAFVAGTGIHLGVAIALRTGGLIAPALRDVPLKDIDTLNRELLDLVQRTRAGSLKASELADATITVTSLGEQGVRSVFPIIYPPQVAIVGFGRVSEQPWVADGAVRAVPLVTASLGADHRTSDGHRGGLFLAAVREALQRPEELAKAGP
jgi:pyruvate dehydrogenase E2 component (dihydrolipoamide acetyltransferase)